MTNTYGVTFLGAKKQVEKRLKEARAASPGDVNMTDSEITACSICKLTHDG